MCVPGQLGGFGAGHVERSVQQWRLGKPRRLRAWKLAPGKKSELAVCLREG